MAGSRSTPFPTVTLILSILFLLQLFAPLVANPTSVQSLEEHDSVGFLSSELVGLDDAYSHDFSGTTLNYDGLSDATVREESALDVWMALMLEQFPNQSIGTPDLHLNNDETFDVCWTTQSGEVYVGSLGGENTSYPSGEGSQWTSSLVDSVMPQTAQNLVNCALSVNEDGRQSLLYADGANIKSARMAYENSIYPNGDTWQNMTILYDMNPTDIELASFSNQSEWAVFRDTAGKMWQLNSSSSIWQHSLLDAGPVGHSLELEIDSSETVHLAYTVPAQGEVRLIRYDGATYDHRVLLRDASVVDHIGMGLDSNAVEQIITALSSESSTTLQLLRSLAGQDEGRINPVSTIQLTSSIYDEHSELLMADVNGDGFDDVVFSTPSFSSVSGVSEAGQVTIHYGSSSGLSSTPDWVVVGSQEGQQFGKGLAVGDYNGDGFSDVAVGSPGWNVTELNQAGGHGKIDVYLGNTSEITPTSWWNFSGTVGDALGWKLASIERMNGDLRTDLAVVAGNFSEEVPNGQIIETYKGKIVLFSGNTSSLDHVRNISQTQKDTLLGHSLSGAGDLNADGYDDLLISNANDLDSFQGYPVVEIYYGSSSGYNGTADFRIQTNKAGKMFGFSIEYLGDIDNDGYDDMMFSELFNSTSGLYQAGVLRLYNGGPLGITTAVPDWQREGPNSNAWLGHTFKAAGDVNEDGFDDVLVMQQGDGTKGGKVEIALGSATGLVSDWQLLASGGSQEYKGLIMATQGDIDGDGLNEVVLSSRAGSSPSYQTAFDVHSEQDWESTSFSYSNEISYLDLSTSARGETSMLLAFDDSSLHYLEHADDGTPTGVWLDKTLSDSNGNATGYAFSSTASGRPIVISTSNSHGILYQSTTSYSAVEKTVVSSGTMGAFLGSALDSQGHQHIAHAVLAAGGHQILTSIEDENGWTSGLVKGGLTISNPITVVTDSSDLTTLVYRDSSTDQLELSQLDTSWTTSLLGQAGQAVSDFFPAAYLSNGDLAVALIVDDGQFQNLSLWRYDGSSLTGESIAGLTDLSSNIKMALTEDDTVIVSTLTSTGVLSVYERQWNQNDWAANSSWSSATVSQPSGSIGSFNLDLVGGTQPALAVRGDSNSDVMYLRKSSLDWFSFGSQPVSTEQGAWDLWVENDTFVLMTSAGQNNLLSWNSMRIGSFHPHALQHSYQGESDLTFSSWNSFTFGDLTATGTVGLYEDDNSTLHLAIQDNLVWDVEVLRLYPDSDRDLVFDALDDLPLLGNQWIDSDGDGFGDNALGPLADDCVSTTGDSHLYTYGCTDYDSDGIADSIDECNDIVGTAWIDRLGCRDLDQDGWSDNDAVYIDGDMYFFNWKLARDSDGDGYGDNYGPDCCLTEYDQTQPFGDRFPFNPSQYRDYDGDGWGDNVSDWVTGDACPTTWGASYRDRNGCLDSDFDGASDPANLGTDYEWGYADGADYWPDDGTQWGDRDGDGYGDNSSDGATNPDRFPDNIAAAEDNDSDGLPDRWTQYYDLSDNDTTNDGDGLVIDGCPGVYGNSTSPYPGCPDTDGDGWMDSQDSFPLEKTQWLDFDEDGFGDNPNGFEADECPADPGVREGTEGFGCRFIDDSDDDGDFISNQEDICKNTDAGLTVNSVGCAENQLDDDGDGVFNDADLCPLTNTGLEVDTEGCSESQRESDTDGDGVFDPLDQCSFTPESEAANLVGCSESQRDTDQDGVYDLVDECPDTESGFPVDSTGCVDTSALDSDLDGDGYFGVYSYTINELTGLRENQQGDAFPTDLNQWWDQDGDGYGDNSAGLNADACPTENGSSYIDFLGCIDDGDGYRDEFEPQGLAGDPTQWEDSDYDGYGDNPNGSSPDLCLDTPYAQKDLVDTNGCSNSQRDTDGDGVFDNMDNCPEEPAGQDGFADGCPSASSDSQDESSVLGMASSTLTIGGAVIGVLIAVIVAIRFLRREDFDFDDDDDDEDDWGDEDDDPLGFMNTRSTPNQRSPPARGPSSPPPAKGPSGPPKRGPSGPPRSSPSPGGPPRSSTTPSGPKRTSRPPTSNPSFSEEPVEKEEVEDGAAKVRKAKLKIDLSIFEDWQTDDREAAADWARSSIDDGDDERSILMQLQETGWSAPQSRAIFNIARSR